MIVIVIVIVIVFKSSGGGCFGVGHCGARHWAQGSQARACFETQRRSCRRARRGTGNYSITMSARRGNGAQKEVSMAGKQGGVGNQRLMKEREREGGEERDAQ